MMKRVDFFRLFICFALSVLLFSCKGDDVQTPSVGLPSPLSLEITNSAAGYFTADVKVNADLECGKFLVGVVSEEHYNAELKSEQKLTEYIKDEVLDKGGSFVRVDERYLFDGDATIVLSNLWDIEGGENYIVAAFGVTSKGELTTAVERVSVTTDESLSMGDGTLVITPSEQSATNIRVKVELASDASFDVYCLAPVADHELDAKYDGDVETFAKSFAKGLSDGGHDMSHADNYYLFDSSVALNLSDFWYLESNVTYHIVAFGVDAKGGIVGEVACQSSATTAFDDGYAINVDNLVPDSYSITMDIDPEEMVGNYCVYAVSNEDLAGVEYSGRDYDLAIMVRDVLFYAGINFAQPDGKYIFKGVNEVTVNQLRSLTDYTIAVFGVSPSGQINTEVTCLEATTAKPQVVTGSLASIEVVESYPKTFDVKIDKGDLSSNYFVGIYSKEDFDSYCDGNEHTLATMFMEDEMKLGTDLTVVDNVWVFDESTTFNTEFSWFCSPGTEYIVMAFGVDAEYNVASNIVYTYATTAPVEPSDNEISISVHGVTSNAATLKAETSNSDTYYFGYLKQSQADAMSDEQICDYMEEQGGQFFGYLLSSGDAVRYTGALLEPSTAYCAVGYGWDKALSTELQRVSFTTLADVEAPAIPSQIVASDALFGQVAISEITSESYRLFVEPAVEGMEYVQFAVASSEVASLKSDEQIVEYALAKMSAAGAQIQTGGDIYDAWGDYVKPLAIDQVWRADVVAGYNYAMIVFGIDKATLQPTTECVVKNFKTPAGSAMSSVAGGSTLKIKKMSI